MTPLCATVLTEEATLAVVSLSGVNPLICEDASEARVTEPVSSTVETPTMFEAEFGFFRKAIVKISLFTDLVVARVIVATWEVIEQVVVTPVMAYMLVCFII